MKKIVVEICLGTTCFVMGGAGLEDFMELLSEAEREQVTLKPSTCIGLCKDRAYGRAPYARVDGEAVAEATPASLVSKIREVLGK